eukprot:CAMPEP_0201873702 /NCGR_PEP_ID=MMETSP0902-20130614/6129_1 /ASSEMBLY_ACC=CAM_ASM_000551 /TAXON_ID=420261 /ORGANISM="Thalassiosira antarctica, Strain CCMP982" /LENGTH=45 /DNA_ID= /DNA_START= /DNA_END= /DNA_ORIENTATION=
MAAADTCDYVGNACVIVQATVIILVPNEPVEHVLFQVEQRMGTRK